MGAISDLYAGVPVSDLDDGIDWYPRFFGRPPDFRAGDEILWEIAEHAWLFIEPDAAHACAETRSRSPSRPMPRTRRASVPIRKFGGSLRPN